MMQNPLIKEIIAAIEEQAPLSWQEDYDNSGLILGEIEKRCSGVYVCLDVSLAILLRAKENNCNLIISHHPIIFKGIKKIDYDTEIGKILIYAIKNDISLYAAHTNMDNALNGVNGALANKLGLLDIKPLSSDVVIDNPNWLGSGAIGQLQQPQTKEVFLDNVKQVLGISSLRVNNNDIQCIRKVAICGGSGSFLIKDALRKEADIFLTGDIKYHDFLDNEKLILLVDIGHFESEQFIKEQIIAIISRKFCNFAHLFSDNSPNRIKYL